MMKTTDFAEHLATFLTMYLPGQRGLSSNTIMSYRDTFKQVLQYAETCGIRPEKLTLAKFNTDFIEAFLDWLEKERGCSRGTRYQRLAAVRSFARYVHSKRSEYLFESQKIMSIRSKKKPEPLLPFLSPESVGAILAQPDLETVFGRRDTVLLSLLYDSAARVQELCDLRVRDVRLQEPYTVTLTGKGDKTCSVPIMRDTAALLMKYVAENKMNTTDKYDYPLFHNHQNGKLTRAGVTYILKKHCDSAREHSPQIPVKLSPHVFGRHSKAMHMLQAGVNLIYIRDFLSHVHLSTTEIYLRADIESKRAAIEKAAIKVSPDLPDWTQDKTLMSLLTTLCVAER
jgi:site-specific recombinase XerD